MLRFERGNIFQQAGTCNTEVIYYSGVQLCELLTLRALSYCTWQTHELTEHGHEIPQRLMAQKCRLQ